MDSIIGAGPIGCYTAALLAKEGRDVKVFEEHKEIGQPVQCAGLLTPLIFKKIRLDKSIILKKIKSARIIGPNDHIDIKLKEPNLVVDRSLFDKEIAEIAQSYGAVITRSCKVRYLDEIRGNKIGSDGPNSFVSRVLNPTIKRKYWLGVQSCSRVEHDDLIEFYPSLGTYSYVVPNSEKTALVATVSDNNPKEIFQRFHKHIVGKQPTQISGGLIPKYNPKEKRNYKNIFTVGDAAGQVKATSGGGIIPGLECAKALADSLINDKDYEKEWRSKQGLNLRLHLKTRNALDKFNNNDWDKLIGTMNESRNKRILETIHRDNMPKMCTQLLLNNPNIIKYIKFLLP